MSQPLALLAGRARLVFGAVALVAAVAILVIVRTGDSRPAGPAVHVPAAGLTDRVAGLLAGQRADQPYRDPTAAERADASATLARLLDGGPRQGAFAEFGFGSTEQVDPDTARRYAWYVNGSGERAWGALLMDLSTPIRLAIEVPHPRTDIATEWVGLDLFRKVPGSVVLFAGAHRRAAHSAADVAHNAGSFFHALSLTLAHRGIAQVQLHGFADWNLPDADAGVSTGSDRPTPLAGRIAAQLSMREITTCRAWEQACGRLEGTTNVQGHAANEYGSVFVHVELSNSVRTDAGRRAAVVEALAAAVAQE